MTDNNNPALHEIAVEISEECQIFSDLGLELPLIGRRLESVVRERFPGRA